MSFGHEPNEGRDPLERLPMDKIEEPIEIVIPDLRFVAGQISIHGSPIMDMGGSRTAHSMESRLDFIGEFPYTTSIHFSGFPGLTDELMAVGFDKLVDDRWEVIIRKIPRRS